MAGNVILLAIYSQTERRWFQAVLSAAGHRVIAVDNGAKALVRVKEMVPDLVLLDGELPGVDGFSTTRAITSHPDTADVPVIVLLNGGAGRSKAIEQGAHDVLYRPVDEAGLLSKVSGWVAPFSYSSDSDITLESDITFPLVAVAPPTQTAAPSRIGGYAMWIAMVLGLGMLAFGLDKKHELELLRSKLSEARQEVGAASDMAAMVTRKPEREDSGGIPVWVPAALKTTVSSAEAADENLASVDSNLGVQHLVAGVNGTTQQTRVNEAPEPFITEAALSAVAVAEPKPEPKPAPQPANKKLDEIHFSYGQPSLSPGAQRKARAAAETFLNGGFDKLKLIGFSDTTGSETLNLKLSRLRANSVASELLRAGVPADKIQIVAKGEQQLPHPTGDNVDEPLNRCVGIIAVR